MNPRSKKYHEKRKAGKKNNAGNDAVENVPPEIQKKAPRQPRKNSEPVLPKNSATQDDTGGGNDSGKRSDDN